MVLEDYIKTNIDLSPKGIIETLWLKRPVYKNTAAYGHFGWADKHRPWERLGHVGRLRTYFQLGTGNPEAAIEQQTLNRFVDELNSGELSKEMYSWWLARY